MHVDYLTGVCTTHVSDILLCVCDHRQHMILKLQKEGLIRPSVGFRNVQQHTVPTSNLIG